MGTEMVGFSVGVTFQYHARSIATHRGQRGPVSASWEGLEVANRLSSRLEPQLPNFIGNLARARERTPGMLYIVGMWAGSSRTYFWAMLALVEPPACGARSNMPRHPRARRSRDAGGRGRKAQKYDVRLDEPDRSRLFGSSEHQPIRQKFPIHLLLALTIHANMPF